MSLSFYRSVSSVGGVIYVEVITKQPSIINYDYYFLHIDSVVECTNRVLGIIYIPHAERATTHGFEGQNLNNPLQTLIIFHTTREACP